MTIESRRFSTGKEWLSCRDVLWYLVFFGFAINYMLRINLSIAIVAMVVPRQEGEKTAAECALEDTNMWTNGSSVTNVGNTTWTNKEQNVTYKNITSSTPEHNSHLFAWNEYEQGLALGAYYWLHWCMQLPGGLLARRFGTKLVFGWSNLSTALLGFLLPLAAGYHLYFFVVVRALQGFVEGFAWPAMHHMTAKWIPPHERSKFISSYLGSSVGAGATYIICVVLINWFGWESVFYITSAMGVIWYVAWFFLAFDTPQEHPRISEAEKDHILNNIGDSVNHSNRPIPWKAIFTSGPVWLTAIAHVGGTWGLLTLMAESPSYFKYIHGWNISAVGVISASPHFFRMLFSYVFSRFVDWLHHKDKMSVTNLRKLAVFVCNIVQSVLLLGLAYSGCHPYLAVVFMVTGIATSGALSAGTLASCVDLSPNFASLLLGICNMAAVTAGFIAPAIVGYLTNDNQTSGQWRLVYLITVAITVASGAVYIIFGSSELQPWNDVGDEETGEELRKLRSKIGADDDGKCDDLTVGNSDGKIVGNHVSEINH